VIVVDSSAWVDFSLERAPESLAQALDGDGHWVVPEHFKLEALNALRGSFLGGKIDELRLARSTRELMEQRLDVWPTAGLIPRVMQLLQNATTYDAAYVALAEELGCPLVAADAKFARIPGIRCQVVGYE
jgi:predicted nucleic acid-binding protein